MYIFKISIEKNLLSSSEHNEVVNMICFYCYVNIFKVYSLENLKVHNDTTEQSI